MGNGNDISQVRCGIKPKSDLFIIFCLIGTTVLNVLIDRCDASINVIRKYGAAPARIKPPDQKYFNQF